MIVIFLSSVLMQVVVWDLSGNITHTDTTFYVSSNMEHQIKLSMLCKFLKVKTRYYLICYSFDFLIPTLCRNHCSVVKSPKTPQSKTV